MFTVRFRNLLVSSLFLGSLTSALAKNTLYVNGVHGNDNNNCKSHQHACKTIGHAISLASAGDSIKVAAATYTENLTIGVSVKVIGAGAKTTIIDGGAVNTVVTIPDASSQVTLSKVTIRNGYAVNHGGGGIYNGGTLTISHSVFSGNGTNAFSSAGGGIYNAGTLTVYDSTFSKNNTGYAGEGGGIYNDYGSTLTINNSTLSGNGADYGGGIGNFGTLTVSSSTLSGNSAFAGGGIDNAGGLTISNSTFSGNYAQGEGGALATGNTATLQNTIVANSTQGGNCWGTVTSDGYNLSSDNTCGFSNTGDLNNTDPMLGQLGNYGGPTQTIPLLSGSPAIDAGNPNGCTDGNGHLLKTDQRGKPRPDREDKTGCDMGAYERQKD